MIEILLSTIWNHPSQTWIAPLTFADTCQPGAIQVHWLTIYIKQHILEMKIKDNKLTAKVFIYIICVGYNISRIFFYNRFVPCLLSPDVACSSTSDRFHVLQHSLLHLFIFCPYDPLPCHPSHTNVRSQQPVFKTVENGLDSAGWWISNFYHKVIIIHGLKTFCDKF